MSRGEKHSIKSLNKNYVKKIFYLKENFLEFLSANNVQNLVYGCFLHPRFDHPTFSPPRLSSVTHCHQWSNSVTTYFVTVHPPRDEIEPAPTGSKSKRPTPCAIHACELDHSLRRQPKRLGRRPSKHSKQHRHRHVLALPN